MFPESVMSIKVRKVKVQEQEAERSHHNYTQEAEDTGIEVRS